jgi:c-di-GMP-binding flagellar brake protein YcgR
MSLSTKTTTTTRRMVAGRMVPVTAMEGMPGQLAAAAVAEFKDRRRRRRVPVEPMYTSVTVRVLGKRGEPLEGHVLNLSETGMSVQLDEMMAAGQPLGVEFVVAGLGLFRNGTWPVFALAAEVIRVDDLEDFPMGPYRVALRFERVPTMVQAQIARFVMNTPVK